jgi:hypothetical protein
LWHYLAALEALPEDAQAILAQKHVRAASLYTRVAIQDSRQAVARCHPRQGTKGEQR